jgi:hypothetical protein
MKNCKNLIKPKNKIKIYFRERFYMSTCGGDYQEFARKELINKLVLTRYDNRTQRIDNIDFELTPSKFIINNDSQISLVDYYL